MTEGSDEQLVALQRAAEPGDQRAFNALVLRYQDQVVTNCRYLTGSASEAEDLAQDVFVKTWLSLRRFEGRSTFRTWLYRIKAHHCIDHNRSARSYRLLDVDDPEVRSRAELRVQPSGPRDVELGDKRVRIRAALDAIGETLRVPLLLRDMDGMPYVDVARELGIGLSAAKMRVKRGREEFRRLYSSEV